MARFDSAAAFWFVAQSGPLTWLPDIDIAPVQRELEAGALRGVAPEVHAAGSPITHPACHLEQHPGHRRIAT